MPPRAAGDKECAAGLERVGRRHRRDTTGCDDVTLAIAREAASRRSVAGKVRPAYVIEGKEKGSDVNLAGYRVVNGFNKGYDAAIVVANNSELAEPLRLVRSALGRRMMLVNFRKTGTVRLNEIADPYKRIRFRIDMPRYVDLYLSGRLKLDELVSARIALADVNDGFPAMRRGDVARSEIVI